MAKSVPALLYANQEGNIVEVPGLEMVGAGAGHWRRLEPDEWIALPPGSELFHLPERLPVGFDAESGRFRVLKQDPYTGSERLSAVAAFVAPAHTQILSAAYQTTKDAAVLPLFAYTAVGWLAGPAAADGTSAADGQFVVAAFRVDEDPRQDYAGFDPHRIEANARKRMRAFPDNRLVQHLGHCALGYGCPAAKNLFLDRWEAPLPTSPSCNSRCLGCISLQEGSTICATQDRIRFVPTPQEIAQVAIPHLQKAPRAVVSFGQGCEGEPLLQARTIGEAIRLIRAATDRGTINLNTNASLPDRIAALRDCGLDSIRVSLNSCRPEYYRRYHDPQGYDFQALKGSIRAMKSSGGFVSLNYFVLPGFTDERGEVDSLCRFVEETGVDLIQMRNLNIDPQWYLRHLRFKRAGQPVGVLRLMEILRSRFPHLRFGYYNPCLDLKAG